MDLGCRLLMVGEQAVLAVEGSIDVSTVPLLRDELLRAVHRCRGHLLLVDLDGVTVLDDTGMGILLGAAAAARRAGGELELVCSGGRARGAVRAEWAGSCDHRAPATHTVIVTVSVVPSA